MKEEKNVTIFSIPKAFIDPHIVRIQKNAIASWCAIPNAEVFLMGNDPGVAEVAREFGCVHIPDITVSEYGTPLLDSAFDVAHERALTPFVMYINADIILPPLFFNIIERMPSGAFLAVGQRIDLDLLPTDDGLTSDGRVRFFERAHHDGKLHSVQGIDYFLFRKGEYPKLPPFAIGRGAFDPWILRAARKMGMPLIDATRVAPIIHQNHPNNLSNIGGGKKSPEAINRNLTYMKNKTWYYTIADADKCLTEKGLVSNYFFMYPYVVRFLKMLLRR